MKSHLRGFEIFISYPGTCNISNSNDPAAQINTLRITKKLGTHLQKKKKNSRKKTFVAVPVRHYFYTLFSSDAIFFFPDSACMYISNVPKIGQDIFCSIMYEILSFKLLNFPNVISFEFDTIGGSGFISLIWEGSWPFLGYFFHPPIFYPPKTILQLPVMDEIFFSLRRLLRFGFWMTSSLIFPSGIFLIIDDFQL